MTHNKLNLISSLLLTLVLGFSAQTFGQSTASIIATEAAITESVNLVPCKNEDRTEAVKKLFEKLGAKPEEISVEKFNKDKNANIVLRKKGKTDETIVIGAHYDKVDAGCGVVDNWTGVAILAHTWKTLSQMETQKSYIFVAFDREEEGLQGSDTMAKAIPKEKRAAYCSMVNFDSFGTGAPMALGNASSSKMVTLAKKLGEENKFKFVDLQFPGANSDSSSFKSRDIPAITMSGLDGNWMNYMHSKNDQLSLVNMKSVYYSYRFGLVYISKLDTAGCADFK